MNGIYDSLHPYSFKLDGDMHYVFSQYRIEFRTSENEGITICNIEELSNHYK